MGILQHVGLAQNLTDINCWNVVRMFDDYRIYCAKFIEMLYEL